jgi:hypothetical protein
MTYPFVMRLASEPAGIIVLGSFGYLRCVFRFLGTLKKTQQNVAVGTDAWITLTMVSQETCVRFKFCKHWLYINAFPETIKASNALAVSSASGRLEGAISLSVTLV